MTEESPGSSPHTPPAIAYPWCPYTADIRKQVLMHMEAKHPQRWRDLGCYPPMAGPQV